VRSVLPLETRSTIASASPSRGASSTEPCTSTSSTVSGSSARASRGKLVATRAPARSASDRTVDSVGTAASSVHAPKPRRSSSTTSAPLSSTMSSPVMPQSTTPSCTYSGTSSARTRSASTGALRHGKASARSPGVSGPRPASWRSSIDGSRSRPFDGTAILRRSSGAAAGARASSRPRRGAATVRPASRSSSRRAPGVRPPGTAAPRPAAGRPASGAPSRRAPRSCRGRAGIAPPRPSSGGRRSQRRARRAPRSANVVGWRSLLPSC
jgi:translation initiation factor IF-2